MTRTLRELHREYLVECWLAEMEGHKISRLSVIGSLIRECGQRILCHYRGHAFLPDGRNVPESGGEGFTCHRCGKSFMAWH